ncbi:MAG: UDP-N-acetylenolpyruvoylglucosamine reductase [Gammaproteobacteria bacterium RIFCSPHIGHO2_12_FULL_38_11]|nr:MAG: UDP-N-acetylenolpyruvoylglucosamine reductase [Gammaproteobacteria bacterium RIFCSPHIGHO2_12_FULL_38_11]
MTPTIEENKSLKSLNTFGIITNARYFVTIHTVSALKMLLADSRWESIPKLILGGGSNILFTRDFDGLVIHNAISGIEKINENADHVFLKIGAGENWHKIVLYCIKNNYAGIENLSLIPGTMGAAPIQNIGAYGVELKDVLYSVEGWEIPPVLLPQNRPPFSKGVFISMAMSECEFGYRDSIFKHALKNKVIITHVTLRLNKKPHFHTEYGAIKELIKNKPLSIKAISDAVIKIRREKLPDPKIIGNAGSFFKNPIISEEQFLLLQKKYPTVPHFTEENAHIKIPAGWLIEQCGLKGKRFGNVGVHEHQALVLINYGNGTGDEIKQLSEHVQATVFEKYGIELMTEVNII